MKLKRTNLILGMTATGKSTYIAALGHILLTQEVETTLRLTTVNEDEGYISVLQQRWLKYEELKHTPTGGDNWISFQLSTNDGSKNMAVQLPDFAGESLKSAVVTGIYPSGLFDVLKDSTGIFLFTSAGGKHDDVLLNDLYGLVPEPAEAANESGEGGLPQGSATPQRDGSVSDGSVALPLQKDSAQFDPMEMPEQVKVVQLLQATASFARRRRRLVIMISAWDVVAAGDANVVPSDWLETNRPMLWQYLNYNPDLWDVRVYGVSAQGGRLPQDKAVLQKILRPSERVKLVGHDAGMHDLTSPLAWLASE